MSRTVGSTLEPRWTLRRPTWWLDGCRFDSRTGSWSTIAVAPTPVTGSNVAVVGKQVYLLTVAEGRADTSASMNTS